MLGSSTSRFIGRPAPSTSAKAVASVEPVASSVAEPPARETSHSEASTSASRPPPIVLDGRAVADEWQARLAETNSHLGRRSRGRSARDPRLRIPMVAAMRLDAQYRLSFFIYSCLRTFTIDAKHINRASEQSSRTTVCCFDVLCRPRPQSADRVARSTSCTGGNQTKVRGHPCCQSERAATGPGSRASRRSAGEPPS